MREKNKVLGWILAFALLAISQSVSPQAALAQSTEAQAAIAKRIGTNQGNQRRCADIDADIGPGDFRDRTTDGADFAAGSWR
jgi:hypothetical protein